MNKDFVLNSDTKWEADAPYITEVKLEVSLFRKRFQVEALKIEMTIKIDGGTHSFRATHSTPDPSDTVVLEVACNNTTKLYRELHEYIDRLNKE